MSKRQNTFNKIAIFAGAAALMALTPQTHAQSSVDALLNKLEQKGILSVDEARELRTENEQGSADDFNKALGAKFPMPDWVTSYNLYGDFRGRYDEIIANGPVTSATSYNGGNTQIRLRYRMRVGMVVTMKDDLEVGFRLGTDDAGSTATGGNPLSNNSTFQGNGSKKFIYVDAAYGKWTPINDGTWMAAGTFGKMNNPFVFSPMVFDPDYTPEGGALQATYKINDKNSVAFNSAAFVLNQFNTRDPFMYGGQIIWTANWTPKIATSLGIGALDIANINQGAISQGGGAGTTTAVGYDTNLGNTTTLAGLGGIPILVNHYNPVIADASVVYTLDSFPLYTGAFPIKLAGEYMANPCVSSGNSGWWAGVTLGKSGKKGSWDISYRYQYLEADAWWDQIVDDDNVARFLTTPTSPVPNTTVSAVGGTNIKGSLIKFDYSIYDSLTFTFTCYINDLINNPSPGTPTDAMHTMADLMWKF